MLLDHPKRRLQEINQNQKRSRQKSCWGQLIEDISDVSEPEVIEVEQEKKYCSGCQQVVTAKSELALPKSDIGLNLTILICYLWGS